MQTAAPIVVVVAVFLAFAAGAVIAHKRGYKDPSSVFARCLRGHLFETVWVPPRTRFRMIHLGWTRAQRCPVGGHLTLVSRVEASGLSPEQKKAAREIHDEFMRSDGGGHETADGDRKPGGSKKAGGKKTGGRKTGG